MATLQEERLSFENALKRLFEQVISDNTDTGQVPGVPSGGTLPATRLTVVNYVKAKLDELLPQGEGLTFQLSQAPNVTNWLDLIISAHLEEAVKHVIMTSPLKSLKPSRLGVTQGVEDPLRSYTGYIELPDNFLLLYSLRMVEWQREVSQALPTTHKLYANQAYVGIRGGIAKPKAFLSYRTLGYSNKKVIEYYSVKYSHDVDYLYYLHSMLAEDFVAFNPLHYDSLAWMCAAKILQITNQTPLADKAMEQVQLSYKKFI